MEGRNSEEAEEGGKQEREAIKRSLLVCQVGFVRLVWLACLPAFFLSNFFRSFFLLSFFLSFFIFSSHLLGSLYYAIIHMLLGCRVVRRRGRGHARRR
jgi:membrane protein implicated in regulation of membrane protease activity